MPFRGLSCETASDIMKGRIMGYGHDGLTFNSLRGANKARLPQFQNCHGEPAHSEPNGRAK